jgi:multiple sugar transport system substrate-binding protein
MVKKKMLLLLTLCSLVGLVSCGSSEETGVDGLDPNKTYNIEFFGWGSAEEQENFQELVDYYNDSQSIVHVRYSATDSSTFMTSLKNKGNNLPDVFYMPDYNFMEWAQSGKLMKIDGDFTGAITEEDTSAVWPHSVSMYRYDKDSHTLGEGDLYGLPKDLGPYTLVYNKTMLDDVISLSGNAISLPSSEVPMTFSELTQYLLAFKEVTEGTKYEGVFGISSYEIMAAVYSNASDFYKENGRTSNITDPRFSEAIQWIADLCLENGVMPTASQQTSSNGYQRFLSGGCLFTFMGPWDLKAFWNTTNFDFDVIPVAKGNHDDAAATAWLGSVAYCISNYSKNKAAALDFIKFLSLSEKSSEMNYQLGQAMPNIMTMAENDRVNDVGVTDERKKLPEHKQVFVDITKGTDTIKGKNRAAYFCPSSLPYDNLLDSLTPVWNGEKTASEFLASYDAKFQKDLDDAYYYFD